MTARYSAARPATKLTRRSPPASTGPSSRKARTGGARAGLLAAVEMCNNNGTCRKFDAGVMCPSYRVTRDEVHLTPRAAPTR